MNKRFVVPDDGRAPGSPVLELQVGPLVAGQRVRVTTANGQLIGAISPFGPAAREQGGVYSLPVPREAIRNGVLDARVTIEEAGKPPRPPAGTEVLRLELQPGAPP